MIRFKNPHWKSAVQIKAEQHAPAVTAWLQANPGNRLVTLGELRTALPAIAADLSRPVINHICSMIGAEIENPEDQET